MATTYDVRVWSIETIDNKTPSYRVGWRVAAKRHRRSFRTRALAESFRAQLMSAAGRGEAFDIESGHPLSVARAASDLSWYDFACTYVDMKWPRAAGKYRKAIAEALTTVTPVMFATDRGMPDEATLRLALRGWAFNAKLRDAPDRPADVAAALRWAQRNTLPVSALADPKRVRAALDAGARLINGKAAVPNTANRKRAVLANALGYAVELGLLDSNPIGTVKWTAPKAVTAVDRRCVVNPVQARTLFNAVREQRQSGPHLVAFFGLLYFAALRPEEAVNIRLRNLSLPAEGWGELHLERAAPDTGKDWTDSGQQRDERQLKHRGAGDVRPVPSVPELTALLRAHLDDFGTAPDGRLFRAGRTDGEVRTNTYTGIWRRARAAAFTPEVVASPLGRRPYDLRHAAVSTWLNGGVPATQVAEWAGHSVEVLLRVYAKCLDGQQQAARLRVEEALGGYRLLQCHLSK
jgi:integrase